jgi:hypothetical protein
MLLLSCPQIVYRTCAGIVLSCRPYELTELTTTWPSCLSLCVQGTIIEVNVSELGLVTTGGKVVWGKYAQVTNNPENDGCVNAVLLV